MENKVLIVDFGSQYTQLIARRIRELFIFCEIYPYNNLPKKLLDYKAVVFSGSPYSVYQEDSPNIDLEKFIGKYQFWQFVMELNLLQITKRES